MKKRTPLSQRTLPSYTQGEERMNTLTHAIGIPMGFLALMLCQWKAQDSITMTAVTIYGLSMICVYTVSAVYHGLKPGTTKKVMQVVDHCAIYLLIAGSYTAIVMTALLRHYRALALGLLAFQWLFATLAIVLTAIDLKKYHVFSMVCYIGMGWAVIPFWRQAYHALTAPGFHLLLAGGIAYSIGSVLYGLGRNHKWMHSIFHLFVLAGSLLQFLCIVGYAL